MTLKEFRSDKDLVLYAQRLFKQEKFQFLLEAVRNEHPKNYRAGRGLTESDNSVNLGRVWGFDEFDNTLMSAATMLQEATMPLVPSFAPEPLGESNANS